MLGQAPPETSLFRHRPNRVLVRSGGENVFEGHVDPFQHPFLDLTEDAYLGSHEAENDFSGTRRRFRLNIILG
jgi:hypothetical protein